MTRQIIYRRKKLSGNDVVISDEEESEDNKFLATVKLIVATTHKDRAKDILTKDFIRDAARHLSKNTTFFLNHKTDEHPIGRILSTGVEKMDNGNLGTYVEVGLSKTAETVKTLIEEGIYNKASIGFYIDEYEYDEKNDVLIIEKGEVVEASLVGIPANANTEVQEISSKKFIKQLKDEAKRKLLNQSNEEPDNTGENNMDDEKLKSLFDEVLSERDETWEKRLESNEKELQSKLDEYSAQLDKSQKALEEKESQISELQEKINDLKKEAKGRQTSGGDDDEDPHYTKDEELARWRSYEIIGETIKNNRGKNWMMTLYPSTRKDVLHSYQGKPEDQRGNEL